MNQRVNKTPVRAVGIDPAARTGVVAVDIPVGAWCRGEPIDPSRLELVSASTISQASKATQRSRAQTNAERDMDTFEKLRREIWILQPDLVVIEEPADQGFGLQARSTSFSLGKMYGIALAAVYAGHAGIPDVHSYLVSGWSEKRVRGRLTREKRDGWMPKTKNKRGLWHTMEHDDVEAIFREAAARMTDRRRVKNYLSEHEIMAFGVLCFHLSRKD